MNSSHKFLICDLHELPDPGSYGFEIDTGFERLQGFVVRKEGEFHAYRNACPHTGAPLDWVEHQFLDADSAWIQCAVHDARFAIQSGVCVAGPCPGEKLKKIAVKLENESVYLHFDQPIKTKTDHA